MVKVLQVLAGLGRGGMETFIMNVYRSIERDDVQFDFLLRSGGGAYIPEAESLGAKIYYTGKRHEGFTKFWKNLDTFFREHAHEYAAVHVHTSTLSSVEPLYYAKKYGIPVRIVHSHSSSVSGNKLHYVCHYLCKFFISTWATDYLGCSKEANDWLYKYTGVYKKAQLIPNGIISDNFKYNINTRLAIRKDLSLQEDDLVIGHVGRFVWMKNHKFILDILKETTKIKPNTFLLLVGDGKLMNETIHYSKSLGIFDHVKFLGQRSDVNKLLQAMDVFILPSIYEGLPVCLVESQAAGLLTICSDNVSFDSSITSCIYYYSLKEGSENWARMIFEKLNGFERKDQSESIINHGFDIKHTSQVLKSIYKRNM